MHFFTVKTVTTDALMIYVFWRSHFLLNRFLWWISPRLSFVSATKILSWQPSRASPKFNIHELPKLKLQPHASHTMREDPNPTHNEDAVILQVCGLHFWKRHWGQGFCTGAKLAGGALTRIICKVPQRGTQSRSLVPLWRISHVDFGLFLTPYVMFLLLFCSIILHSSLVWTSIFFSFEINSMLIQKSVSSVLSKIIICVVFKGTLHQYAQ